MILFPGSRALMMGACLMALSACGRTPPPPPAAITLKVLSAEWGAGTSFVDVAPRSPEQRRRQDMERERRAVAKRRGGS